MIRCCFIFLIVASAGAAAASRKPKTELERLKMQHKVERKSLKAQEKAWRRSFRGRPIPRAEKIREKHQMQRDMRNLKQRQKDQIQDYKDHKMIQREIRTS
jgi:hypothetical protein